MAGRGDVAEADHGLGGIAEALDLEAEGSSGGEGVGGEFKFELRLLIGTVEGDAGDAAVAGSVDGDGPQFAAGVGGDRDGGSGGQFRFGSADGEPPLHRYFFVLGIAGGLYLPAIGLSGDSFHFEGGCLVSSAWTNAADAAVAVEIPTGTVFEEPVGTIGGELEVHGMAEAVGDLHQFLEVIILVKFRLPEFAAHPIVGDETVVIVLGEKIPGALGIVVENRAGHGVAAAGFHDRELGGIGVGIPDEGLLGRGENFESGVAAPGIARSGGVGEGAGLAGREIDDGVGLVVADEEGPAEVAGLACLVDFVVAHGTLCVGFASVGSHFAPIDVAGFGIE